MAPPIPKRSTGKTVRQGHTASIYGTDPSVTGVKGNSAEPTDLK